MSEGKPMTAAKRRVLYCDHTVALSGGEIALLNLIRNLDRNRFEPVAALFARGPLNDRLRHLGVEVHEILLDPAISGVRKDTLAGRGLLRAMLSPAMPGFVRSIRLLIQRECIDIVHTNSLKADILAGLAARGARRHLIWHIRDRIAEDYLPRSAVRLMRALTRTMPHRVIANSQATLDTLRFLPDNRKGVVVHDGMDPIPTIPPYPPPGPPVIGLVGRIAPWKGQHVFLEAAAIVRRSFPAARFLIVGTTLFGETEYAARVRAECTALGLDDVMTFTGFVEDVGRVYGQLAVLVHASTVPEPFGQVVLEGMMYGRPVVATNAGRVPEIVVDGKTGILVPPGDAAAMASAIETILKNPGMAVSMGQAGRERALAEFPMNKVARKVEAVYDGLYPGHR